MSVGAGGQVPPHPSVTVFTLVLVLLCVPLPHDLLQSLQALHDPQAPHWQFRGCVPVADSVLLSLQSPILQPALQVLVLVWVKGLSQASVEVAGDHGDHRAGPQGTHSLVPFTLRVVEQSPVLQPASQVLVWVRGWRSQTVDAAGVHGAPQTTVGVQDLAPVALRLVEQSPVLQPALQVLVCVKECPEQKLETAGDHEAPQRTHDFVPLALRLVAQSPVLQPALQVLVWVKDWPEQTVEVAGDHEAVPQLTGVTGFSAEHTPEFDPPSLPSQRHLLWLAVSATAPSLAVPAEQPLRTLSSHLPSTAIALLQLSEFAPPCRPSQRQRYALEVSAIASSLAVPAEQPLRTLSSHAPSTAMYLRHFSEFLPPCRPSQRQRWAFTLSGIASSLAVPVEQPLRTLSSQTPFTGMNMWQFSEFAPPCWPSQRQR